MSKWRRVLVSRFHNSSHSHKYKYKLKYSSSPTNWIGGPQYSIASISFPLMYNICYIECEIPCPSSLPDWFGSIIKLFSTPTSGFINLKERMLEGSIFFL